MKKTLVVGASSDPLRFSHKMIKSLLRHNFDVVALGFREGEVGGLKILTGTPDLKGIHTVSLYIGPRNQPALYAYILGLKPARIIFNPGTVNPEFMKLANEQDIEVINDCALAMLSSGEY